MPFYRNKPFARKLCLGGARILFREATALGVGKAVGGRRARVVDLRRGKIRCASSGMFDNAKVSGGLPLVDMSRIKGAMRSKGVE
jgi:hypothetical protein